MTYAANVPSTGAPAAVHPVAVPEDETFQLRPWLGHVPVALGAGEPVKPTVHPERVPVSNDPLVNSSMVAACAVDAAPTITSAAIPRANALCMVTPCPSGVVAVENGEMTCGEAPLSTYRSNSAPVSDQRQTCVRRTCRKDFGRRLVTKVSGTEDSLREGDINQRDSPFSPRMNSHSVTRSAGGW
jgi:hypothetical protein